jgi:phosphohistidine phosphatase
MAGGMPGTKQLFVLRHAKSSWDDPAIGDHDRPLTARGRRAAGSLARHISATGIEPSLVLCSSSRRTRETLDGIRVGGQHVIEPELYGASGEQLLERLRRVPDSVDSVMLVGHNPGVQTLVLRLAANDSAAADPHLSQVQDKFPTGALATLTFAGAWSALAPGCARLTTYVRPKSLGA